GSDAALSGRRAVPGAVRRTDGRQPAGAMGRPRRRGPAASREPGGPTSRVAGAHRRARRHRPAAARPAGRARRYAPLAQAPSRFAVLAGALRESAGAAGAARRRAARHHRGRVARCGGERSPERVAPGGRGRGGLRRRSGIHTAPARPAGDGEHHGESGPAGAVPAGRAPREARKLPPARRRPPRRARRRADRHQAEHAMRVSWVGLAVAALAAGTTRGRAQGLVPAAGLSLVSTRVRGTDQLTGTVLAGQGALALGRLELAVSYVQGKIGPEGAGAAGQDLVEGVALLGVRPASWLRVAVGPHARSYTLTGGTELRWVF